MRECKYLIVGGGLSGKILALGLAHYNISSCILEREAAAQIDDTRTIALNSYSANLLQKYAIWSSLADYVSDIKDIYVVDDRDDVNMLHFSAGHVNSSAIGHMIESGHFNRILNEIVDNSPLISRIYGAYSNVETDGKIAQLLLADNNKINAQYLIAADGKRSIIAAKFFKKLVSKQYNQTAITFKIKHEKPHNGTAIEHFMPSGPFALLPLRDQHSSSVVWCDLPEMIEKYTSLPLEELALHLAERTGPFLGKIELETPITSKHCFKLGAEVTKQYFYKNIALIADAAHSIHPLSGQGLNQGIKDIASLTEIISTREYCGLKLDEIAFGQYEQARKLDNYLMYQLTDKLSLLFSNNFPFSKIFRRTGLSLLDSSEIIKEKMISYAIGARL